MTLAMAPWHPTTLVVRPIDNKKLTGGYVQTVLRRHRPALALPY